MQTLPVAQKTDYTADINAVLDTFFKTNRAEAALVSPYYRDLWNEVERLLVSGGKRLRPKTLILAYRMMGGKDVAAILPAAAAQEFIHLGMLIHDDIIDRDYIRYGVDNVAGSYDKIYSMMVTDKADRLHYAQSAAILAGDLMLSSAYLLMAESSIDPQRILQAQRLFGRGIFEVIGGEFIDTESAFRALGDVKSETVAFYKTASYTFVAPMLIGAVLADATIEQQAHLRSFAENLGVAFQLRDDIIGVFGDEELTGKSTSGDIREGKRTYMVEQFYELADGEDRAVFDRYFGNHAISNEEVETVRGLLVNSGAKQKTLDTIDDYEIKARAALSHIHIDQSTIDELETVITISTKRDK